MSYYEKGEHFVQERHTKGGFSRETMDEEHWQKGTPVYVRADRIGDSRDSRRSADSLSQRYSRVPEKLPDRMYERVPDRNSERNQERIRVPSERIIDDYRRTDYGYEDDDAFVIRRPNSIQSSIRDSRIGGDRDRDERVYTVRNGSRSDFGSPNGDRSSQAVSRPGSPGPVAGAGDIINTEHGFTIQLDVKHFRPEEIKVILNDDLLCVSGERIEESPDGQTLRRSFSRKYSIPSDIHLDSIRSHLADNGFLIINGSRRGWKETNISTHAVTQPRRSGSVISTV